MHDPTMKKLEYLLGIYTSTVALNEVARLGSDNPSVSPFEAQIALARQDIINLFLASFRGIDAANERVAVVYKGSVDTLIDRVMRCAD